MQEMSPNPPPRHRNQQGSVSSPVHRTSGASKTGKLLKLFEDHLFVRCAERAARDYLYAVRSLLTWLDQRGVGLADVRTTDLQAYQTALYALRKADGTPY